MTYEEAIRLLHPDTSREAIAELKYYNGFNKDKTIDTINEAIIMVCEAAEKQIPKKPEKLTYQLLLDDGWIYKCPNCGCACGENKYYLQVTADEIYCSQCGQKIDWE